MRNFFSCLASNVVRNEPDSAISPAESRGPVAQADRASGHTEAIAKPYAATDATSTSISVSAAPSRVPKLQLQDLAE